MRLAFVVSMFFLSSVSFGTCQSVSGAGPVVDVNSKVPPSQAVSAGFTTLSFDEEFSTRFDSSQTDPTAIWSKGFWFGLPDKGTFTILPGGGLRIVNAPPSCCSVAVAHPFKKGVIGGPSFLYGYFEARMRFSAVTSTVNDSWATFWMESKNYLEQTDGFPGTQHWCELDVFEALHHFRADTAQHSWTKHPGQAQTSRSNPASLHAVPNDPLDGNYHVFGVLRTNGSVSWYMDNILIDSFASFPICNTDPLVLIVGAQAHRPPVAAFRSQQTTDIAWVRVWQ